MTEFFFTVSFNSMPVGHAYNTPFTVSLKADSREAARAIIQSSRPEWRIIQAH